MTIEFSDANDSYVNGGTAVGDVLMLGGNDLYEGSKGILDGRVFGGNGNDRLIGGRRGETLDGGAGADRLKGGGGNDVLRGGAGNDVLEGGSGKDVLVGGAGRDSFVFGALIVSPPDLLRDFSSADDTIRINNGSYANVGPDGALAAAALRFGTAAADASDRIIYDRGSGRLFYDADGVGGDVQTLVASLSNKAALRLSDFYVI